MICSQRPNVCPVCRMNRRARVFSDMPRWRLQSAMHIGASGAAKAAAHSSTRRCSEGMSRGPPTSLLALRRSISTSANRFPSSVVKSGLRSSTAKRSSRSSGDISKPWHCRKRGEFSNREAWKKSERFHEASGRYHSCWTPGGTHVARYPCPRKFPVSEHRTMLPVATNSSSPQSGWTCRSLHVPASCLSLKA